LKREIKEKVDDLLRRVEALKGPDAPDSWVPFSLEGENFVLASKEIGDRIEVRPFRREGIWREIGRYLEERGRLLDEIEKTLREDPEYDVIAF